MIAPLLTEVFNRAVYAKRNPTRTQYEMASPAEQRAIVARWREIADGPAENPEWAKAYGRLLWLKRKTNPPRHTPDSEPRGFNEELFYEGRPRGGHQPWESGE